MRWYEYKMEVDDLTAPDDLKAKLLAMTDTLTAEEKDEPMMAAPAPQAAAPAAPLNTETKKKKPIHFPVKQLGTLAACLAVCVLGYSTLHLGIGMGSAKSSAPALYAAEGAANSSAASVASDSFAVQHAALDSAPEAVNYSLEADDRSLETEYSGTGSTEAAAPAVDSAKIIYTGKPDAGKQGLRSRPQCAGQRSCRSGRLSGIQQRVFQQRLQPLGQPDLPGAAGQLPELSGCCGRCR